MKNIICKVLPGSIAEEVEIEKGDKLISINEQPVCDILDYKFLISDEYIVVTIEKSYGEVWDIEIEKDYNEDLGIEFQEAIMDEARSCHNNCMFCFIDQLPKGMRKTLYFKDDDSRLSFLQGNFVTLTNLKDEDIDRIIRYKISPINVSVHTTNPELRKQMLNNRFAGNIYERLKKLVESGIMVNCQIVLCPDINDGEELIRTIEDLYELNFGIENVAVVPVGVTKYRQGLHKLKLYDKETALREIKNMEKLQKKYIEDIGTPFVRLSDEFYVTAEIDVPDTDFYEGFSQIEDGVGMIRLFRNNIEENLGNLTKTGKGSFTVITGQSAYKEIADACDKIEKQNNNININAKKIINNFFGPTITVAGLTTGTDIKDQLKDHEVGEYIIIPENMLKSGEKVFLDDITVEDLERFFKRKVIICDYTGEDLIDKINSHVREE